MRKDKSGDGAFWTRIQSGGPIICRNPGESLTMKGRIKIVIAEDHTILREGLRMLLSSNPDFEVVGEAQDGLEAIRLVKSFKPDLVLMDLSMPRINGLEAIQKLKKLSLSTKILVLTVHKDEERIISTLKM